MDLSKLSEVLKNEPKYRIKQAKEAVFKNLIGDWSVATNLPPKLREALCIECPLKINAEIFESSDKNVVKAIITLSDGLKIESVLMRHNEGNRSTVCVSSQVGCPMGCGFCSTGAMGFKRNLTEQEIIEQVLFFARYLKNNYEERVNNVVFMGMGEPFLNYDNVISAVEVLNDKESFEIGARRISISTSGIVDGINKLADEKLQVNLAISLHAPNDDLRLKLMPVNKKYPLSEVLKAVNSYIKKTSRQVMFEYVLLKDINDTPECADQLAKLMKKPLYFVNLIVYNPACIEGMEPSRKENIKKFREILEKANVPVSQRYHFGGEIKAACGQLSSR